MSVPTNAYGTKKLKAVKNLINYDTYLAKFLQNTTPTSDDDWGDGYFNSTDDDATKKSKILDIFKLDGFVRITGTSEDLFAGYINDGSANEIYHNNNRIGVLKLSKDGTVKKVFNDAGLNTLGFAAIQTVLASSADNKDSDVNMHPPRINNSVVFAYFKSAYYASSTLILEMEVEGLSDSWYTIFTDSLPEKLDTEYKSGVIGGALSKSGVHKFRAKLTNSEGTWISGLISIDIKMAIFSLKYDASYASASKTGTDVTRYANTRYLLDAEDNGTDATQLFKDETASPEHTDYGFYYSDIEDKWYKYGYDTLTDRICILTKGVFQPGGYPPGDPANIIINDYAINCNGFDKFDQSTANTQVLSNNYNPVDIYMEDKTDYEQEPPLYTVTYFQDAEKTAYASEGYYAVGDWVFGVTREIQVGPEGSQIYDNIL